MGLNSTSVKKWGFGMRYDLLESLAKLIGGQDPNKIAKNVENIEPYKYLLDKIGHREVKVYQDNDPQVKFSNPAFNSFKESTAVTMKYKSFVSKMGQFAQGFTMKDDIDSIDSSLLEDIPKASFYDEFSNIFAAEIEQG